MTFSLPVHDEALSLPQAALAITTKVEVSPISCTTGLGTVAQNKQGDELWLMNSVTLWL
jgi:hypothetical protein